jgi:hypothetical protein
LILAGLRFYAQGTFVTNRYWKYREEVSSFLVELKTESSIYINSINMLVIGVIEQKDMSDLLASSGGELWKEQKFSRKL